MKTYETIINLGDMKLAFRATLPDDAVVQLDTREHTSDAIDAVVAAAKKQGVEPEIIVRQQPAQQQEIKQVNHQPTAKPAKQAKTKAPTKRVLKVAAEKVCRECGKTYKPTGNAQVFCPDCKPVKAQKLAEGFVECASCGCRFVPYEGHNGLCNPHCTPLTDAQKAERAEMLRTGYITLNQPPREG